jgi:lipopolysaccharide/colanic/teichoic acid biosynthesis glycosyltransferase
MYNPNTRRDRFLGHKVLLAVLDMLALAAAFYFSYVIRNAMFGWRGGVYAPTFKHLAMFVLLCLFIVIYFRHHYLYRRLAFAGSLEHLELLIRSWVTFVGLFIAVSFFFKVQLFIEHRITVFLFIVLGMVGLYLGRFLIAPAVARQLIRTGAWPSRTLFIGPGSEAHRLAQLLDAPQQATGYQMIGYLDPERQGPTPARHALRFCVGQRRARPHPAGRHQRGLHPPGPSRPGPPDESVPPTAPPGRSHPGQPLPLRRPARPGAGAAEVEHGYVFINASPLRPLEQQLKNTLDRLTAGIGLLLLSPVLATLAVLIKLDSRGPVFFRQDRVGRGGRVFSVYKFRTMAENTEAEHQVAIRKLIEGDHAYIEAHSGQAGLLKVTNTSKVTALGGWLRRTSLDELPQLINVWQGDMSLVGPRPLPRYEVDLFKPWQHARHDMHPGITGFWQVFGRSAVSHADTILMDIFYIMNWSLALDLRILARTVLVVLTGRGGK